MNIHNSLIISVLGGGKKENPSLFTIYGFSIFHLIVPCPRCYSPFTTHHSPFTKRLSTLLLPLSTFLLFPSCEHPAFDPLDDEEDATLTRADSLAADSTGVNLSITLGSTEWGEPYYVGTF